MELNKNETSNKHSNHKNKKTSLSAGLLFMPLNDEHQGEGGTLVFVDADNTTACFIWQEAKR